MNISKQIIKNIKENIPKIKFKEPMSKYTSFRIGGPVELMAFPESEEKLIWLNQFAIENHISFYVLGKGTNLLVKDKGINGLVINMKYLNQFYLEKNELISQAGAALSKLLNYCIQNSLKGLEFATGIPGSLGGAVIMNAGANSGLSRCYKL